MAVSASESLVVPAGKLRRGLAKLSERFLTLLLLIVITIILVTPLVWMLSTALKEQAQIFTYPPEWIPDPVLWSNFREATTTYPFGRYATNTLIIAGLNIVGVLLTASMAAYAFARLRFPGRDLMFMILLSTLMLPFTVLMIPRYIQFRELGWLDSWKPLIVPNWFGGSVFFIFLLRQFFRTHSERSVRCGQAGRRIRVSDLLANRIAAFEARPGGGRRLCLSRHLERLPGAVDLHHLTGEIHRLAWAFAVPRQLHVSVRLSHGGIDDDDHSHDSGVRPCPTLLRAWSGAHRRQGLIEPCIFCSWRHERDMIAVHSWRNYGYGAPNQSGHRRHQPKPVRKAAPRSGERRAALRPDLGAAPPPDHRADDSRDARLAGEQPAPGQLPPRRRQDGRPILRPLFQRYRCLQVARSGLAGRWRWTTTPSSTGWSIRSSRSSATPNNPTGISTTSTPSTNLDKRWTELTARMSSIARGTSSRPELRTTGRPAKPILLDICCRFADLICDTFGPEESGKTPGTDGHEEVELALVELGRVTGNRRYIDSGALFPRCPRLWPGWRRRVPSGPRSVPGRHRGRRSRGAAGLSHRRSRRHLHRGRRRIHQDRARSALGQHDPAPHLCQRRHRLALGWRSVRPRSRAWQRTRLYRKLRRHRQRDVELAHAANHWRRQIRRPDRESRFSMPCSPGFR